MCPCHYRRNEVASQADYSPVIRSTEIPKYMAPMCMNMAGAFLASLYPLLREGTKIGPHEVVFAIQPVNKRTAPEDALIFETGDDKDVKDPEIMIVAGGIVKEGPPFLDAGYSPQENQIFVYFNQAFDHERLLNHFDYAFYQLASKIAHEMGHAQRLWQPVYDPTKGPEYAGSKGKMHEHKYRESGEEMMSRVAQGMVWSIAAFYVRSAMNEKGAGFHLPSLDEPKDIMKFVRSMPVVRAMLDHYLSDANGNVAVQHIAESLIAADADLCGREAKMFSGFAQRLVEEAVDAGQPKRAHPKSIKRRR